MSDEANAPSNGAPSDVAQVSDAGPAVQTDAQVSQTAEVSKPAASAREALDRAFETIETGDGTQTTGRERGADGKFVAKQGEAAPPTGAPQNTAEALAAEAAKAAAVPAAIVAPTRFTKEAQAAWTQTPPAVQTEINRAITELTQGMEKYKGEVETTKAAFEPLRRFDEMAKGHGTTLEAALTNYTGIEQAILQNPVSGFLQICRNMNLNPQAVGQALAGLTPQQLAQATQQAPTQQQQTPAEIKALQERIDKMEQSSQERQYVDAVTSFASETDATSGDLKHPYFEELADSISQMLETKFAKDLPDAYAKAVRLNPEIADRIASDKAAKAAKPNAPDPAQTREKANKSITGSPNIGSNPAARKPASSPREALDNAFAAHGL